MKLKLILHLLYTTVYKNNTNIKYLFIVLVLSIFNLYIYFLDYI